MKISLKLLCIVVVTYQFSNIYSACSQTATSQWTASSGTVSSAYYINTDVTLTGATTIQSGGKFEIRAGGTLRVANGATLTIESGGRIEVQDISSRFFVGGPSSTGNVSVESGGDIEICNGRLNIGNGQLTNVSVATISVYGDLYVYDTLKNGDATAGNIDIYNTGRVYVLGGTINNAHSGSLLNIESGGALYNYYGDINIATGGSDSLVLAIGGTFNNVRGTNPGAFTLNSGGNFVEDNDIVLETSLDLDNTWTVTDQAVLDGRGREINFGTDGEIAIVGPNASLLLKNVGLNNVSGNKIRCTDHNTTLSLDNIVWKQDANYTFSRGSIYVAGDVVVKGPGTTFNYETVHTSTIASDVKVAFEVAELNCNTLNSTPLKFTDATSVLSLEHTTIKASQACNLADGTMIIKGLVTFQGDATLDLSDMENLYFQGAFNQNGTVLI